MEVGALVTFAIVSSGDGDVVVFAGVVIVAAGVVRDLMGCLEA